MKLTAQELIDEMLCHPLFWQALGSAEAEWDDSGVFSAFKAMIYEAAE